MLGRSLKSGDSSYGRILIFVPDKPLDLLTDDLLVVDESSSFRKVVAGAGSRGKWLIGSGPSSADMYQRHTL
jgi:hypothetical protein